MKMLDRYKFLAQFFWAFMLWTLSLSFWWQYGARGRLWPVLDYRDLCVCILIPHEFSDRSSCVVVSAASCDYEVIDFGNCFAVPVQHV